MPPSKEDPVAVCLPDVARHLEDVQLPAVGGDVRALRERHLAESVHEVVGQHLKTTVASIVVPLADWPLLGRSATDFVVDWPPGSRRPRHVGELKWCQLGDDKVYEAIWDLFKMALMTRRNGVQSAHLITGAPAGMWPTAFCGDLFDGGTFEPAELCQRRFSRGGRRTAWDYLLEGGYGRHPNCLPGQMRTTPVAEPVEVSGTRGTWQIRAVRVETDDPSTNVPCPGGWPDGLRPADARYP